MVASNSATAKSSSLATHPPARYQDPRCTPSLSQPSIAGGTFIYDAPAVSLLSDSTWTRPPPPKPRAHAAKQKEYYYTREIQQANRSIGLNSDGAAAQRVVGGAAAPVGAEARRACGAGALRLAPRRRAAVVPLLPPVGVHGPLGPVRRGSLLAPLPRPRRGRPRRGALPPRLPRHAPPLLRGGPALPLRRLGGGLPLPLLLLPPRGAPPPALPRQAPHQERPRPAQLHRPPRLLLPPPRLPRRAMLRRRGRLQGLVVRHLRRQRALLRQRGAQRRRGLLPRDGLLDVPQRRLPPHLRAVQAHLPPPGAPPRGLCRVAVVRGRGGEDRRRAGAQGAPRHPKAAQGHQPPVQEVHRRRAAHRHRKPVLRRAPHHATRLRRRPPQHRRARALFSGAHVRAHHNPEQRRQDHSPGAGPHRPHHQVARLLHHRAGRRRGGGHADVQPQLHDRARPSERKRLGIQRGDRGRRRGPPGEHQVHAAASARPLVPEEAGASDVPGEQQSRDHRVRVHAGPGVPAHHLHARVDALPVAARQDHRILVNVQVEVVVHSRSC